MQYVAGAGEEEVWACGLEPDVFSLQWLSGGGGIQWSSSIGPSFDSPIPISKRYRTQTPEAKDLNARMLRTPDFIILLRLSTSQRDRRLSKDYKLALNSLSLSLQTRTMSRGHRAFPRS